jgi:hypothetical protein
MHPKQAHCAVPRHQFHRMELALGGSEQGEEIYGVLGVGVVPESALMPGGQVWDH